MRVGYQQKFLNNLGPEMMSVLIVLVSLSYIPFFPFVVFFAIFLQTKFFQYFRISFRVFCLIFCDCFCRKCFSHAPTISGVIVGGGGGRGHDVPLIARGGLLAEKEVTLSEAITFSLKS